MAILEHPDVRRMLLRMKALTEGARALLYYTAGQVDRGTLGDSAARARGEVLTPLIKAWGTDIGIEVASLGVQVHGGMGFVEETGAAQHWRDSRIAPIYEGTNGSAADLVTRKLGMDGGEALTACLPISRVTRARVWLAALAADCGRPCGREGPVWRPACRLGAVLHDVRSGRGGLAVAAPETRCRGGRIAQPCGDQAGQRAFLPRPRRTRGGGAQGFSNRGRGTALRAFRRAVHRLTIRR